MPHFLKTPHDEALWEKAKGHASDEGHAEDWPYITGIYKRMNGGTVKTAHQDIQTGNFVEVGSAYHAYIEKLAIVAPRITDNHFVPKMHPTQEQASWGQVDQAMGRLGHAPDAIAHPELHTPHVPMTPVTFKPDMSEGWDRLLSSIKRSGLAMFADDAIRLVPGLNHQQQQPQQPPTPLQQRGNAYHAYMKMAGMFEEAATAGALGAGTAYIMPPDGKFDRSKDEVRRDTMLSGGLAAAIAPAVMAEARKLAAWPFDAPTGDPGTRGDIYAAKSKLSRVKLTLGNSFKKLAPEDQKTLLAVHDKYHKLVETSIRDGKIPGGF